MISRVHQHLYYLIPNQYHLLCKIVSSWINRNDEASEPLLLHFYHILVTM